MSKCSTNVRLILEMNSKAIICILTSKTLGREASCIILQMTEGRNSNFLVHI